MSEGKKKAGDEGDQEENKFPPILKYILIALVCFIAAGLASWASIEFGVEPTFEVIGGTIVFFAIVLTVSMQFEDKILYAKRLLIFATIFTAANILYLVFQWTGGKVYEDESLWSPSIIAILFFAVAIFGMHLSSGSKMKTLISTLLLLLAQLFFVLIGMVNGDEEGVRLMFTIVFSSEILIGWGFVRSVYPFTTFNSYIVYSWGQNLYFFVNLALAIALATAALVLPYVAITKWPLTNWQIVTAISSVPTAWYFVYAVWGKKYLK